MMFNAEKLLGNLLSGAMGSGRGHSSGYGHGHSHGTGLLGGAAGMAAIGLAIGAFEHFAGQNKSQQPAGMPQMPGMPPHALPTPVLPNAIPAPPPMTNPGMPPAALPATPPSAPNSQIVSSISESDAVLLIRTMIAAAYADGVLDQQEMKNIMEKMESAGLDNEERSFILKELSNPAGIDAIIGDVSTPALAQQVYAVSLMTIDVDTDNEKGYMNTLAKRLFLSDAIVAGIHERLGKPLIQ
jgi:uncharacterized membrane protein YebE (DUF533 family)